jgi:very-short-patch-repair endonuclease
MRLERLLDTAVSRNLVSAGSLHRLLAELARRGRPGISLMRELLAARGPDHRPAESGVESRFQELARRAGMRGFERQHDLGDDDGWIGRVDFVDRERSIIVETDTALYHGSLTDRRRDEMRRRRLTDAGWRVLVFTGVDVFDRPDEVVGRLRQAYRSVLAGRDCRGGDDSTPVRTGGDGAPRFG